MNKSTFNESHHNSEIFINNFFSHLSVSKDEFTKAELEKIYQYLSRELEFTNDVLYDGRYWIPFFGPLETRRNTESPVVDLLIKSKNSDKCIFNSPFPNDKKFALFLSHDIDHINQYAWKERWRSFFLAKTEKPIERIKLFLGAIKHSMNAIKNNSSSPYPLDIWLSSEEKYGFKSTFYFVPDLKDIHELDANDCFYRHNDKTDFNGEKVKIKDAIKEIYQRGWDVGLHGSISSSNSVKYLKVQKESIEASVGEKIVSNRQHYLKFNVRTTPQHLEQVGFTSDASMGTSITPGYRCGTGMPFALPNATRTDCLNILELPLIYQDVAFLPLLANNENLVLNYFKEIFEDAQSRQGILSLLWHNNHHKNSFNFELYCKILDLAHEYGAWGCSATELREWWDSQT